MLSTTRKQQRGSNFSKSSINTLLTIVERHLPTGQYQWERVAVEYNERTRENRPADSLKKKFKQLKNVSKPSGKPNIRSEIERAKKIAQDMENAMGVVDCDDDHDEKTVIGGTGREVILY